MPTYQYACTECDAQLEVRQSFTDDALTVCPTCEGRLRKIFNAVGVVFKGSGFYKTDSRKTPETSSSGADAGKGSGSGTDSGSGDSGSGKDSGKGKDSGATKDTSSSSGSSGSGDTSSGAGKASAA